MKSLRRIWAVALLTASQGLRQPAFFVLFAAAAVLTAFAPRFAVFHLNEGAKMVVDLGLSTALGFSSLLIVLTASQAVSDEIENRTTLTLLSKPLTRLEYLAGKFFGVAATCTAFIALLAPVFLATLRSQQFDEISDPRFNDGVKWALVIFMALLGMCAAVRLLYNRGFELLQAFWIAYFAGAAFLFADLWSGGRWDFRVASGLFFTALHGAVLAAFALALSTRLSLLQAFVGTAAFFMLGHASGALLGFFRDESQSLTTLGLTLRAVLPDLDQFNVTDALATAYIDKPIPIPLDVVACTTLYAACYSAALLTLGILLFSRRELS